MNRPKKHNKSKRPELWTHPLCRAADLEARHAEERAWAQARPLLITSSFSIPGAMILFVVSFKTSGGSRLPLSVADAYEIPELLAHFVLWFGLPLFFVELIARARRTRRWVNTPVAQLHIVTMQANLALTGMIAVALAAISFVAVTFTNAPRFPSLFPILLGAIYLITTGIHRRTGWDRRCSKCAYPHPDPKPYPITCPECGRTLRPDSHTDIILGKNVRSALRIITGVLALIAMTALIALT